MARLSKAEQRLAEGAHSALDHLRRGYPASNPAASAIAYLSGYLEHDLPRAAKALADLSKALPELEAAYAAARDRRAAERLPA